ncbi:MAG: penicillin acylase family protein [Acidobacteriota bacterium]
MPKLRSLLAPLLPILLAACQSTPSYEAKIRRTDHGVAHIEAADLGSLGFGEGYAQAEDHLCTIADQVIKARGERARFFGRGPNDAHLHNDLVMRGLRIADRGAEDLASEPEEVRDWYRGFAAGYNRYLEETGTDGVPGWCRGAEWVRPITAEDLGAHLRQVVMVIPRFGAALATAQPPSKTASAGGPTDAGVAPTELAMLADLGDAVHTLGASNGWALGADWTASGGGMLVANPHYPWVGANRFWEKHLTVPGDLDVYGVGLIGVPGVAIGFNRNVAWTHTVSAGQRLTLMSLDLVPGDPTRYRHGDTERSMTRRRVDVAVRGDDGSIETVARDLWLSHHGPIVSLPGVGWTADRAIAVRDANSDNDEARRQWLAMNRADGMDALQAAHATYQGMPWVNTIAASADGRAWYTDSASTPNVGPEALAAWQERRVSDPLTRTLWERSGLVLLDGSDPLFDWQDDPDARDPGVVAYPDMPQLERRDYVWNANDSFWLAHAPAPIEGDYSSLHGAQRTVRSLRSRNNELTLSHRLPTPHAGEDRRFSLQELADALLDNHSHAAALLKPDLLARCVANPSVQLADVRYDLGEACDVLARWDDRFDVESRGAVLFREWITQYDAGDLLDAGALFAEEFDPERPIDTPRGLAAPAAGPDGALVKLAKAARLLQERGLALDTTLGSLQYHDKGTERFAIHGGDGAYEGLLNLQRNGRNRTTLEPRTYPPPVEGSRFLTEAGYPVIHGSSFILVLDYTPDGPVGQAILTYSQSGDPASVHFHDQTALFAEKKLRPVRFDQADVAAHAASTQVVRAPRASTAH